MPVAPRRAGMSAGAYPLDAWMTCEQETAPRGVVRVQRRGKVSEDADCGTIDLTAETGVRVWRCKSSELVEFASLKISVTSLGGQRLWPGPRAAA
jgi:hypothetical protein